MCETRVLEARGAQEGRTAFERVLQRILAVLRLHAPGGEARARLSADVAKKTIAHFCGVRFPW